MPARMIFPVTSTGGRQLRLLPSMVSCVRVRGRVGVGVEMGLR